MGCGPLLDIERQLILGHDAGLFAAQPLGPPTGHLMQMIDVRPRISDIRARVLPGAYNGAIRSSELFGHTEDWIRIAVGPATEVEDGAFDRTIVRLERTLLPIAVVSLVMEPGKEPGGCLFEP